MKDNKKILDQVKNAVSSKKLDEKKPKNDFRYKNNSNETKKIVLTSQNAPPPGTGLAHNRQT